MLLNSKKYAKQNRSKRYLQPPALYSFDLLSSMSSQDRQQKIQERIDVLPDVEEKSYFSCEQSDIIPPQCHQLATLARQPQERLPVQQSRKNLRIEDQAIIVVEEEGDLASNNGEESVILQHIQFKSETHLHENTPNWEQEIQQYRREEGIKCEGDQPPWMKNEEDYGQQSFNADFSYSQIKLPKNRVSKNTCIDRVEHQQLLDFENNLRHTNKSCIARPTGNSAYIQIDLDIGKPKENGQDNFYQVRHLLDNEQVPGIYQIQEYKDYQKQGNRFNIFQDSKFCLSRERKSNDFKSFYPPAPQIISNNKQDIQIQTDLSGNELLQNQVFLNEQITFLKSKMRALQEQNMKYKQATALHLNQMITIMQSIAIKDREIMEMKQEKQQKGNIQVKKLIDKNMELQKIITIQSNLIKEYQEASQSQTRLSKLQSTNIITRSLQKAATFGKYSQSIKLLQLQTSNDKQDKNPHRECRQNIEELQQYIFDLQQRMARVDTETQRKIASVTEQLEEKISFRSKEKYQIIIEALKEELTQARNDLKRMQKENRINLQQWSSRQIKIKKREIDVTKMYDELVKEWQAVQKEKEHSRRTRSKAQQNGNLCSSRQQSKQSRGYFQAVKDVGIGNLHAQFSSRDVGNAKSTRDLMSYAKKDGKQSFSSRYQGVQKQLPQWSDRQSNFLSCKPFGQDICKQKPSLFRMSQEDTHQLSIINHKIQKLRNEITRELGSMQ